MIPLPPVLSLIKKANAMALKEAQGQPSETFCYIKSTVSLQVCKSAEITRGSHIYLRLLLNNYE